MTELMSPSDLAGRLNLRKYPRSWRGACPACDYPRAFSLRAGTENRSLLYCVNGCDRNALQDALARRFGEGWLPPAKSEKEAENEAQIRARKTTKAIKVFSGGSAINPCDPAGLYLAYRNLPHLISSPALRYRADCRHPEDKAARPALVAVVVDVNGQPTAIHRTYLTRDGKKAKVEPQKASKGPIWGGAIRLDPVAPEIVVGEGIETSASAGLLLGLPAWAAISAGNLGKGMALPPQVRAIVVAADYDFYGARAARDAANRWLGEGRQVRIAWPNVEGQDFNDILRGQSHAA